jgi:hypothetical protein
MALLTNSALQINVSWSQTDSDTTNTGNQFSDIGAYVYNRAWQSGTGGTPSGYSACGQLFHEQRTLTANQVYTYNMTGLLKPVFSGNLLTNFSNVRCIYLENLGSGTGCDITVYAIGSSGFSGLFRGGSGNLTVAAKSPLILANFITGYPTSDTNNTLFVRDINGSGCTIRISIVGI